MMSILSIYVVSLLYFKTKSTGGVANGKFHDSPDVGQNVFNSDETERNTLKQDFAIHQKHFRDLDVI